MMLHRGNGGCGCSAAEYEAQLAQRRYEQVDPANRLVAASLEQRWNEALGRLEEIRQEFADFQRGHGLAITTEQRAKILALAKEFPRLWNAPTTPAKDKKRMLRLLVKDITVERLHRASTGLAPRSLARRCLRKHRCRPTASHRRSAAVS